MQGKAPIDGLRDPDGGLSREAIKRILPYGEDFLFLDRVSTLSAEEIEASYRIPDDSPILRAHFADFPIMPAALLAEGCAQAGTLLVRYNLPEQQEKEIIGLQIESARFLSPARPGDTLSYHARLANIDSRAARVEGRVRIGERSVARSRMVLGIVDRAAFRKFASS